QHRAAGRKTVSGRADGRADDQSVATVRRDGTLNDRQPHFDHLQSAGGTNNGFVQTEKGLARPVVSLQHAFKHQVLDDAKLTLLQQWKHVAEFVGGQVGQESQAAKVYSQDRKLMPAELMARSQ